MSHALLGDARVFFGVPSGGLAQLVERCLCKAEVRGSSPLASTLEYPRVVATHIVCSAAARECVCLLAD